MFFISESPYVDEEDTKKSVHKKFQLDSNRPSELEIRNNLLQQQQIQQLNNNDKPTFVIGTSEQNTSTSSSSSSSTSTCSLNSLSSSLVENGEKMFEKRVVEPHKLKKSTSLLSEMLQQEQERVALAAQAQAAQAAQSNTFPNRLLKKKKTFPSDYFSQGHNQHNQQGGPSSKAKPSQVGVAFDGTESLKKDLMKDWEPYIKQKQYERRASADLIEQVVIPSYQSVCKG